MRNSAFLVFIPLLAAGPAFAQSTSQQSQSNGQSTTAIQQQVQKNLKEAGFTDIKIMPSSFLVRAKDKDGNPVMMMIDPDSVTAVTAVPAPQTSGQGSSRNSPPANSGTNSTK